MLPETCYDYRENMLIKSTTEPSKTCENCGEGIYEGEAYYNVHGAIYCVECISDCEREA